MKCSTKLTPESSPHEITLHHRQPPQTFWLPRRRTRRAGGRAALNSLAREIAPGRGVGLLGRNGGGKSALLHIACVLLLPSSGTGTTVGRPCGELDAPELSPIGFMPQKNAFLACMTVRQQLDFTANFYPA